MSAMDHEHWSVYFQVLLGQSGVVDDSAARMSRLPQPADHLSPATYHPQPTFGCSPSTPKILSTLHVSFSLPRTTYEVRDSGAIMDPSRDMAGGTIVKVEMPADDDGPFDLNDGTCSSTGLYCFLLISTDVVKNYFVREAILAYEESGHTRMPYTFETYKLAQQHILNVIRGRLHLPIFQNHGHAEALGILCQELLKDPLIKGCIKHPDPTPEEREAQISALQMAAYDSGAAPQDASRSSQGTSS